MDLKNTKRKIGLYGRESSRDQVEKGFNLEGQFDKCHDWLNIYSDQYSGERIEYIEKAISGTKWRRKELQRLIVDIKNGMVGVVIIHNLDRLTRSVIDLSKLLDIFEKHSVEFVSVQEKIELIHLRAVSSCI